MTGRRQSSGVVWFRRDLRLEDNPAWAEASSEHDRVLALFVLDEILLATAGPHRRDLLLAELHGLDEALAERGGRLHLRTGDPAREVVAAVEAVGASGVYWNSDVTPYSTERDHRVTAALTGPVSTWFGSLVHEPGAVLTAAGTLSRSFSAFHKRWMRTHRTPWPEPGDAATIDLAGQPIPDPGRERLRSTGAAAARRRLADWSAAAPTYSDVRDLPAVDGTSRLSVDLHFGTLGPRQVVDTVGESTPGAAAFVRQLAWRDWYAHLLHADPEMVVRPIDRRFEGLEWIPDDAGFGAWCEGRTGYPIVDAAMRELSSTGWMHNRLRMITASFLVKDLLVDWRRGERWFRRHLIDGDVAQNVGNWQWVAGVGADAAPYFRVFNPVLQARRFDPSGDYVRQWLPELSGLAASDIHAPWEVAPLDLAAAGVVLGDSYPAPIVDHAWARERALATYAAVRQRG